MERALLSIAMLSALFSACVPQPRSCLANLDCGSGESCVQGHCLMNHGSEVEDDESCQGVGCTPVDPMLCKADDECTAGQLCELSSGLCIDPPIETPCTDPSCNPPPTSCASDADCGPPGNICENTSCVPSCVAGVACGSNSVCDTTTGRCQALTGPCADDAQCGAPISVCELGQCVPGCGRVGGVQCTGAEGCDSMTGRCFQRTDICLSDLDCARPSTVCNLVTGACDPGCTAASCTPPDTCDPATGHCNGSAVCDDDVFEDNDVASSPSTLSGSILNLSACPGDDDYYGLFLGAGDDIDVEALFTFAEGDLDLEVIDPDGAVAASSRMMGSNERVAFTANTAGPHQLRVFMVSELGPKIGVPYSISAQITLAPCAIDDFEPNNAISAAALIPAGVHAGLSICVGDDDFYGVQLPTGPVTISVDHTLAEGDIDLLVTNASGTSTWSTSGGRTPETISLTVNSAGLHIIRVYLTSDPGTYQGNTYTLTVSPSATAQPPRTAPDNPRVSSSLFDVPLSPFTTMRLIEENAARTVREREERRAAIVPEVDAFVRGAGFVPEPAWHAPPPTPRLIGRRSPQLAAVEADIAFLERAHRSQLAQAQQLVARIGDHQTRMEWFELLKQVAAIALVPVSPPAALVSAVMALRDRLNLGTLGNDLEAAVLELARMGALLAAFQHVQHAVVVGLNQLSVATRAAPPCPAGTPRKCRDLWHSAHRLRSHAEELVNLRAQRWFIERFHNFARVVGVELEQSLSAVRALESDAEARCRASRMICSRSSGWSSARRSKSGRWSFFAASCGRAPSRSRRSSRSCWATRSPSKLGPSPIWSARC